MDRRLDELAAIRVELRRVEGALATAANKLASDVAVLRSAQQTLAARLAVHEIARAHDGPAADPGRGDGELARLCAGAGRPGVTAETVSGLLVTSFVHDESAAAEAVGALVLQCAAGRGGCNTEAQAAAVVAALKKAAKTKNDEAASKNAKPLDGNTDPARTQCAHCLQFVRKAHYGTGKTACALRLLAEGVAGRGGPEPAAAARRPQTTPAAKKRALSSSAPDVMRALAEFRDACAGAVEAMGLPADLCPELPPAWDEIQFSRLFAGNGTE